MEDSTHTIIDYLFEKKGTRDIEYFNDVFSHIFWRSPGKHQQRDVAGSGGTSSHRTRTFQFLERRTMLMISCRQFLGARAKRAINKPRVI